MFDVGFQELALIGVIALIVVGPERLPGMARTVGVWVGKIRHYVSHVKDDIEREIRAEELKKMLDQPASQLDDLYDVVEETKGTLKDFESEIEKTERELESSMDDLSEPDKEDSREVSVFPAEPPAAPDGETESQESDSSEPVEETIEGHERKSGQG